MRPRFVFGILVVFVPGWSVPQEIKGGRMDPGQVVENVKQKNWGVVAKPGLVRTDAGPALLRLLDDKDSQVRQLVVTCLDAVGGSAAREGLIKALRDRTETVRAAAARFLRPHFNAADLPTIVNVLDNSPDEYVREQLALLLGESGDTSMIPILSARLRGESNVHARNAASLAMARLGDPGGRMELIQRLSQDDPAERVRALRDLPYLNDRRLLAYTVPLIDDTRPGLNMGRLHAPYFIRVCDVAINVASQMLGARFAWAEPTKRHSPQEINEARVVLSAIQ